MKHSKKKERQSKKTTNSITTGTKKKSIEKECNHTGKKNKGRCKLCWGNRFICLAIELNGDKFGYSLVRYKNSKVNVKIICNTCGNVFKQTPNCHLMGQGCPECAGKLLNTQKIIQRAIAVHGNKFDYSYVRFKNMRTKIKIKCNTCHKIFEQSPYNHIGNHKGCSFCSGKLLKTKTQFISEAREIHHLLYDYIISKYVNMSTKIDIKCNTCNNIFKQTPKSHLKGNGCSICSRNHKPTTAEYVLKMTELNGNLFDYSMMEYVNNHIKICIKCNTCNLIFWQKPSKHSSGRGCPRCKKSKGERAIELWLINNNVEYNAQYRFKDCRGTGNKPMPFDFYLPKYNLLIEYDGEQHFKRGKFNGHTTTISELRRVKTHDKLKSNYCKLNRIKLLRIPYWDMKNIQSILEDKISLHNNRNSV